MNPLPTRLFTAFLTSLAILTSACSIPVLESPDCTAARQNVKEFYSTHFGAEMRFSPENLKLRARFLTPEFAASLEGRQEAADVFTTGTEDLPKAFRVGGCEITPQGSARFEVLLFWKDDVRTEQQKIYVESAKRGDRWLIDKISQR